MNDFDPAQYKLTDKRNNDLFVKDIIPDLLEGREGQARPRAVFLVAQPGSGKSRLQKVIDPELKRAGGYIDLDTDLYKPYHDQYDELMQRDDKLMAAATGADGREWMAKAQEYARKKRINVIVQDIAMDPEHSAQMMRDYRDAGYSVSVAMMAAAKVASDQGINYRYFEQVRGRGAGRLTVQAKADQAYEGVAGLARLLDEQPGLVERVQLFRRGEGVPCYDNTVENGQWSQNPRLASTLVYEREERPWTYAEVAGFTQMQNEMRNPPTPKVVAKLGPEWSATLASLEEQAAPKLTGVPQNPAEASAWLSSYQKHAETLIHHGELGPKTAPTMLALHAQADRVAAVAYAGQDSPMAEHTKHQAVQKAVFMAGERGVDNADLPSNPHEFFTCSPQERQQYVEAMQAATTPEGTIPSDAAEAVRRAQQGLAPPGTSVPEAQPGATDQTRRGPDKDTGLER